MESVKKFRVIFLTDVLSCFHQYLPLFTQTQWHFHARAAL